MLTIKTLTKALNFGFYTFKAELTVYGGHVAIFKGSVDLGRVYVSSVNFDCGMPEQNVNEFIEYFYKNTQVLLDAVKAKEIERCKKS